MQRSPGSSEHRLYEAPFSVELQQSTDEELPRPGRERGRAKASRSGNGNAVSSHGSTSAPSGRKPVSALVVTWNNVATLAECMTALYRELPAESEILTFDNRSLDDSAQIAQDCGALVQRHGSNIGFAAGLNTVPRPGAWEGLLLLTTPP